MTEVSLSARPFVCVSGLSKRFGSEWALARATFALDRGDMALLTGSNGSGKTTLIGCLSTSLVPDYGSGSVDGLDLVVDRDQIRKKIATLTHPAGFYGGLSPRENLRLTDTLLGLQRHSLIDSLLDRVGLAARKDIALDAFSSGMKQRFALARLALVRREFILLDEPETHLDSQGLRLLTEMIAEWKSAGAAIVCATHAPERFRDVASQQIRLISGRPEETEAGA
ncbi:MAG: ABC transporter ATP-binding protein [Vicinamibacteria bacterium]